MIFSASLIAEAHTKVLQKAMGGMKNALLHVFGLLFLFCITYITLYVCAFYTLSDPKVLISVGLGTSV